MPKPRVTIVISPREHFSFARASLESIYQHTSIPFQLIYVDGRSPKPLKKYLEAQARQRGFLLIRSEHYLSPNQARNLALREVDTEYVAFVDNDVIVSPGWLETLLGCAEETGAWTVGPLYCIGKPEDQIIHMAGGEAHVEEVNGRREFRETARFRDETLPNVRAQLRREPVELMEFHCLLVRADVFERIGPLDEELFTTRDNIDFCLLVRQAGGTVYFEPAARVTQLFPPPFRWSDLRYYLLRWSKEWTSAGVRHFDQKWNLADELESLENRWLKVRRGLALQSYRRRARRVMGWRLGNWTVDRVEDLLARRPLKDWQRQSRARKLHPLHKVTRGTEFTRRAG